MENYILIVINKDKKVVFGNTAGKKMIKNDSIESFFASKSTTGVIAKINPSKRIFLMIFSNYFPTN